MNNQQGQQPQWPPSQPPYGQPNQQPPQYQPQWQQPPSQSLPPQQQWQQPMPPQQEWQWQPAMYPPPQYQQPLQYQPQMPPPQMKPQKPKSRKRLWLIIGAVVLVLIVIGVIASQAGNSSQPATTRSQVTQPASTGQQQQPSAQPTQALQWTTVQTITGNGSKKTAIFNAPGDWKIVWSCIGQNIDGVTADGLLAVNVYNADGSIADPVAVYATCKAGQTKTTGETEEHQGGQVYLSVDGTGDWTIQIQELK